MVVHKCKKCKQKFSRKYDLKRHMNKVFDCVTGSKTSRKYYKNKCSDCNSKFHRKETLKDHLKTCVEYKELCLEIKKSSNKKNNNKNSNNKNSNNNGNATINGNNNSTHINNNTSITNNYYVNNPVMIVNYKDNCLKTLNGIELMKIMRSLSDSNDDPLYTLIKLINFNKDLPQFHNILCSDIKAAYLTVYDEDSWINKKNNPIMNNVTDVRIKELSDILDHGNIFLSDAFKNKIKKTLRDHAYKEQENRNKLFKYIKLLAFNERNMIKNTKSLHKKCCDDINNINMSCDD